MRTLSLYSLATALGGEGSRGKELAPYGAWPAGEKPTTGSRLNNIEVLEELEVRNPAMLRQEQTCMKLSYPIRASDWKRFNYPIRAPDWKDFTIEYGLQTEKDLTIEYGLKTEKDLTFEYGFQAGPD